jgi:serine/threonine-protein kinase RsbT
VTVEAALEESLEIRALSDVAVAQTRARSMAAAAGFPRRAQWEIATAVSEAATNIVKHASHGWVHLRVIPATLLCFEFEAVDHGTGIGDVDLAIRDGVSEGTDLSVPGPIVARRGLGLGLGAIRRLMDRLEVSSTAQGTSLRAQKDLLPDPK